MYMNTRSEKVCNTTNVPPSVSTSGSVTLSLSSTSVYVYSSPSLHSSIYNTGCSYNYVGTPVVPVFIFNLADADAAHRASFKQSHTTAGPGFICTFSDSTPVSSDANSGCGISSSSTKPMYYFNSSLFQQEGSLVILSDSNIFLCCSIFDFLHQQFTFLITWSGATIMMIFIIFSTLPVSRHNKFWVTCIFPIGPREMHSCVIGFMMFVTLGSLCASTYDPNNTLECLLKYR